MSRRRHGSKVFGMIMVFIGLIWLLREMGFGYMFRGELGMWVLVIFGVFLLISGYIQNRRGLVFWGTFLSLLGGINLLQDFRIIHPYLTEIWPLYLGSIGVAFFATILLKPVDYTSAIPGTIFIAAGGYLFLGINDYIPYDLIYGDRTIPALFLILLGGFLLLRKPRNKREDKVSNSGGKKPNSEKANI